MRLRTTLLLGWTLLVGLFGLQFVLDDPDHRDMRFMRRWTTQPLTAGWRVEALFELLCATSELLERESIQYWIEAGALVGWKRNGALIPWDSDLDIGMLDIGFERLQRVSRGDLVRSVPSWIKLEVADSKEHPSGQDGGYKHLVDHAIAGRFIDTRTGIYIDVWRYYPVGFDPSEVAPMKVTTWLAKATQPHELTRGLSRMGKRSCLNCKVAATISDDEKARGRTKPITRYRPVISADMILPLANCTLAAKVGGPSRQFR